MRSPVEALAYCFEEVFRLRVREGSPGRDQWSLSGEGMEWGVWRGQGRYWSTAEEELQRERERD